MIASTLALIVPLLFSAGRISVDFTNFRSDTEYVLHYHLFKSSLDDDREPSGRISIRLRLKTNGGYRSVFMHSLKPPAVNYINVANKNDFHSAHFVCNGEVRKNIKNQKLDNVKERHSHHVVQRRI